MTRYRCIFCGRLTTPAITLGKHVIGPKCAKKAGLLLGQSNSKSAKIQVIKDELTGDLFGDLV